MQLGDMATPGRVTKRQKASPFEALRVDTPHNNRLHKAALFYACRTQNLDHVVDAT